MAPRTTVHQLLTGARERGFFAAVAIIGDPGAAEDAVQEATLRSLRHSGSYDESAAFYPWFYRILKNHCLDLLRRRRPQVAQPDVALAAIPSPTASPEAAAIAAERHAALGRAMATLGDEQREILSLRHFQDLSYDEIAEVLGVPTGTVMSRLYRARRALQDALDADPRWRS